MEWAAQGPGGEPESSDSMGDLVLLQSEGEFGVPVAYWDLFRVADGKIVEHWDVIAEVPDELPHANGLF
ncbi:hypothetical protein F9278_30895 [Streptomyces phaeolivaceus]|uniref:SnoaL-like domain-containing protein n=1 Tax=Streptomyces phaeolivaceus TaxID=2653200 RepID=A0A5P8KB32_9ACTN|nr:hypothetical protein [Streptomyces phaeolivaceus]QFQ99837.1 hypothetical protein F9278_30895 [Streptomyces phaeolivaceus]